MTKAPKSWTCPTTPPRRAALRPPARSTSWLELEVLNLRGKLLTATTPVPVPTFCAALALHTLDLYDNAIPAFDIRVWDVGRPGAPPVPGA